MKKNAGFKLLIFLGSLISCSCISLKSTSNIEPVYVTNTKKIEILPPEDIENNIDQMMLLKVQMGDFDFSTPIYVLADKSGIYITILNDFGIDMGTLEYDGVSINLDCALFPDKLKPVYLINDFQNSFYNFNSLRNNLTEAGLNFLLTQDESQKIRTITDEKKNKHSNIVEEIKITSEMIEINNILRNYKITLIASE